MSIYNLNGLAINDAYDVDGAIDIAYDIDGNTVYERTPQRDYDDYTISTLFTYNESNMQGFAVYDGKIAQVKENSALHIIDIATGTKLREVAMDMGHGNSCQFSKEFYAESDEFPIFYIRNSGVWVYRISGTSSTLLRKYYFPPEEIGTYAAGFGLDDDNRRIYTASYTEGTYQTKTGLMRICVWDMDDVTDNGDGTLSMALLESNDFNWFTKYDAVQGSCFHDGYFFISCGLPSTAQYVVLVDPDTLTIAHEIKITGTQETEGCGWYNDDYLITSQRTSPYSYKKIEFATAT